MDSTTAGWYRYGARGGCGFVRAAIYVRVSSEEQAQHGYSLDAQRHACRIRAQQLGATTMVEFADEGVPGTILERPGLTKLRQAVMRRDVDVVVIYDPDRFARSLAHQLLVTDEIERAKIRLDFVNFEWQNTPEGKLFYAMRGAFSEYEREKIRLRTSTGRIQKARQGKLPIRRWVITSTGDTEVICAMRHAISLPSGISLFSSRNTKILSPDTRTTLSKKQGALGSVNAECSPPDTGKLTL